MDIRYIPVGKNPPEEINVVIEIPAGGAPVKYEIDKKSGALFVDRFVNTAMVYPANYGFVPHTLSDDGDPVDVLVLTDIPVVAGCVIPARPIGILHMEDEAGNDEKILAVPIAKLNPVYANVQSHDELPPILLERIAHFFQHYKDLEKGKWVKIVKWDGPEAARKAIVEGVERAGGKLSAA
ncbi:MAG TPA: inorganic diphosphatase [Pedomonas sp.]|uniref:inorganic diphosphatase n=1 Tax=Pedomonas sp. TaxID=2976421 RepID=UPI002F41D7CF